MAIYERNDLQLTENICKNIELKVHKDLLSTNQEILKRRKTVLKEEQEKMNNINSTVWTIEDKFCNEVWDFHLEHNFNIIFKRNPNFTEIIDCHNCKYSTVQYNCAKPINTIEEDKVTELKNEINNINNQRKLIRNDDIEEDIKNATYILDNLKSFSEEILHLIRLVSCLENSQNICNTITHKKSRTNKGFKSAGKYLKNRPLAIIGENIETSTNNFTNIDIPKKCPRVISNIRLGKFTLKKQSIVSLKFKK